MTSRHTILALKTDARAHSRIGRCFCCRHKLIAGGMGGAIALLLGLGPYGWSFLSSLLAPALKQSHYHHYLRVNIPEPIAYSFNSLNSSNFFNLSNPPVDLSLYQPVAEWSGRLILPNKNEIQNPPWSNLVSQNSTEPVPKTSATTDWVWLELHNTPPAYQMWVGQLIPIQWALGDQTAWVASVTQAIRFTKTTMKSQQRGAVHPTRLNGWEQVGPLQSLAGARSRNDILVRLNGVIVPHLITKNKSRDRNTDPHRANFTQPTSSQTSLTLHIDQMPTQISGHRYGLVQFRDVIPSSQLTHNIETIQDASLFQWVNVQHFNPRSRQFDGPQEIIRIPYSVPDRNGIPRFTLDDIDQSPLNAAGWYIYGEFASDPVLSALTPTSTDQTSFVVQSLEPRSLMQVQPTLTISSQKTAKNYIAHDNWSAATTQKGTTSSVWVHSSNAKDSTHSNQTRTDWPDQWKEELQEEWPAKWQVGDRAIVVHLYGGIGGSKAEPNVLGITTGHFSYGVATIITDPLTHEQRFNIEYQQIYSHNADGIIASPMQWSEYMGNLQRGWQGTRPVSDVMIKFPPVTQDYHFDGVVLSPMNTFVEQLNRMMARYRVGDGTGAAILTPSTSCVQDSNQALYITIKVIEQQVKQTPTIQTWLATHPHHPQTQRFRSLMALGKILEQQLVPLGMIRADWQQTMNHIIAEPMNNALTDARSKDTAPLNGDRPTLAGIRSNLPFATNHPVWMALSSWRTLLPRRSHDEITTIFLEQGASLWVLRTNQIGGINPDIAPRSPNTLFGQASPF